MVPRLTCKTLSGNAEIDKNHCQWRRIKYVLYQCDVMIRSKAVFFHLKDFNNQKSSQYSALTDMQSLQCSSWCWIVGTTSECSKASARQTIKCGLFSTWGGWARVTAGHFLQIPYKDFRDIVYFVMIAVPPLSGIGTKPISFSRQYCTSAFLAPIYPPLLKSWIKM